MTADTGSAAAADGQEALFGRAAVVRRTFDTPGFRGITFHEVHAKTIISKVPEASRVPFRWTINPYRGCSHACTYCVGAETPVLMADEGPAVQGAAGWTSIVPMKLTPDPKGLTRGMTDLLFYK